MSSRFVGSKSVRVSTIKKVGFFKTIIIIQKYVVSTTILQSSSALFSYSDAS